MSASEESLQRTGLAALAGGHPDEELLQRCLDGIHDLGKLPALSGFDPAQLLGALLDVLVHHLELDFAYARIPAADSRLVEIARFTPALGGMTAAGLGANLGAALARRYSSVCEVAHPLRDGKVSVATTWLGGEADNACIVIGSTRPGFPSPADSLLLRVAADQAVIELQRTRLAAEHERAERLAHKARFLEEQVRTRQHFTEVTGESDAMRNALRQLETVAPMDSVVLLQGEPGTGRELLARRLHELSRRRDASFVKVSCATPADELEREMFGVADGAGDEGAQGIGCLELARDGTLFLEDVAALPMELQSRLVRVLQHQEYEPVGSTARRRTDVRVVASTDRDLGSLVASGEFRGDLHDRLAVFPVTVPPLRERAGDVELLLRHFTRLHARMFNKPVTSIPAEIVEALSRHAWPGNVRELSNVIERSVLLSSGPELQIAPGVLPGVSPAEKHEIDTLENMQRAHILEALARSRWVIAGPHGAAARLGVKRTSLQYKMRKLGITRPP